MTIIEKSFFNCRQILARVVLNRFTAQVIGKVYPESQCGFCSGRGTAHMVSCAQTAPEEMQRAKPTSCLRIYRPHEGIRHYCEQRWAMEASLQDRLSRMNNHHHKRVSRRRGGSCIRERRLFRAIEHLKRRSARLHIGSDPVRHCICTHASCDERSPHHSPPH